MSSVLTDEQPVRKVVTRASPGAFTVAQVAVELQVAEITVRRWIGSGDLEAVRLPGGGVRVPFHALRNLPRVHSTPAAKEAA